MEAKTLIALAASVLALAIGGVLIVYVLRGRNRPDLRSMMDSYAAGNTAEVRKRLQEDKSGDVYEKIKAETRKKGGGKKKDFTVDERLFQAGMFSSNDRLEYQRWRLYSMIFAPLTSMLAFGYFGGGLLGLVGLVMGVLIALQIPISILDRKIAKRADDIMFYLPLVIEQISIGVSSSLDIGPCISRVILMADERDSHNAVTELLRHAQNYIKSGVSFEDAMSETGKASGHTELKHAFMFLAQVARHGGEISRQLQELADSVSTQRQTHIEGKIKRLEIVATGPVGLVFMGFMVALLTGFGLQLKNAF